MLNIYLKAKAGYECCLQYKVPELVLLAVQVLLLL